MKQTQQCPKCQGRKLWRIVRLSAKRPVDAISSDNAHPLMLAVGRRTLPTKKFSHWDGDGSSEYDAGHIDAWVCAACGYTELWSRGFEQLVHNPKGGVHYIDATPQQGEYR